MYSGNEKGDTYLCVLYVTSVNASCISEKKG